MRTAQKGREVRIRGVNKQSHPQTDPALRRLPNPAEAPTLTVDQAAKILHVSRASAYKAVHSGEIPSIRVGHRVLVPTALLLAMLGLDGGRCPLPEDGANQGATS